MTASQRTLFDRRGLVAVPRARRRDPATSAAAASSARDLAQQHRAIIEAALRRCAPASATDVSRYLSGALDPLQIMKRMSELLRAGVVLVVDEDGRTATGRRCRRYRLADLEEPAR